MLAGLSLASLQGASGVQQTPYLDLGSKPARRWNVNGLCPVRKLPVLVFLLFPARGGS